MAKANKTASSIRKTKRKISFGKSGIVAAIVGLFVLGLIWVTGNRSDISRQVGSVPTTTISVTNSLNSLNGTENVSEIFGKMFAGFFPLMAGAFVIIGLINLFLVVGNSDRR